MTSGFMKGEDKKHHFEEHIRVFSQLAVASIVCNAGQHQLHSHLTDKCYLAAHCKETLATGTNFSVCTKPQLHKEVCFTLSLFPPPPTYRVTFTIF